MVKLIGVTPRAGYKLYLEYDDGVTGEADLSHLVGKGVFVLQVELVSGARRHTNEFDHRASFLL